MLKGNEKFKSSLYNRGKCGKTLKNSSHNSVLLSEAKRTSCCCDYIATPRKSPIFCDPEAELKAEKLCHKLVLLRERSDRKEPRAPEVQFAKRNGPYAPEAELKAEKLCYKLVLLRERSDRKGPRAPEAKLGKRNSGFKVLFQ
jgi:hypothetical protein